MQEEIELTKDEFLFLQYVEKYYKQFGKGPDSTKFSEAWKRLVEQLKKKGMLSTTDSGEVIFIEKKEEVEDPIIELNENIVTLIKEMKKLNKNISKKVN